MDMGVFYWGKYPHMRDAFVPLNNQPEYENASKVLLPGSSQLMEFTDNDEGPMWMVSDERAFHKGMVQNHKFVWQTQVRAGLIYSFMTCLLIQQITNIIVGTFRETAMKNENLVQ